MRLAFVTDDLRHQAGVAIKQQPDGTLKGTIDSTDGADHDAVRRQVERILSLDVDPAPWDEVGRRDPVIGRLQAAHPGLRPVLFHSPYEAALWSIISSRRHRSQGAALRLRLSQAVGRKFVVDGEEAWAVPTPLQLLDLKGFPGLDPQRTQRLHALASAALAGELEADVLRALPADLALRRIQALPGIGPTYGTLILLRSTGATDVLTTHEPRTPSYVAHYYRLGRQPSPAEITLIAEKWRPFRTWAVVLMRVAGDREQLPWSPPGPERGPRR